MKHYFYKKNPEAQRTDLFKQIHLESVNNCTPSVLPLKPSLLGRGGDLQFTWELMAYFR